MFYNVTCEMRAKVAGSTVFLYVGILKAPKSIRTSRNTKNDSCKIVRIICINYQLLLVPTRSNSREQYRQLRPVFLIQIQGRGLERAHKIIQLFLRMKEFNLLFIYLFNVIRLATSQKLVNK